MERSCKRAFTSGQTLGHRGQVPAPLKLMVPLALIITYTYITALFALNIGLLWRQHYKKNASHVKERDQLMASCM